MRFQFQAVNAKIAAMRGELLTQADLESLCQLGSVEAIGARLRERQEYKELLQGLEEAELRRGVLEERLPMSLYYDYNRIRLYFHDREMKDYLSALFLRFELDALKQLLCMIFDERDIPYSPEMELLFVRHTKLDTTRLVSAKTVREVIDELQGTELHGLLSDAYERQPTLFSLERQLDLYYFMHLWRTQEKLKDKKTRAVMKHLTGTQIDLLNILWIYRLKHYYHISDARIYAYIIPVNYRLSTAAINRMAECGTEAELVEELSHTHYRDVYIRPTAPAFTHPELSCARALRKMYAHEARRHPDSLAVTAAYIFEKEREINNITTALEGVRYGLPTEQIMAYIASV